MRRATVSRRNAQPIGAAKATPLPRGADAFVVPETMWMTVTSMTLTYDA